MKYLFTFLLLFGIAFGQAWDNPQIEALIRATGGSSVKRTHCVCDTIYIVYVNSPMSPVEQFKAQDSTNVLPATENTAEVIYEPLQRLSWDQWLLLGLCVIIAITLVKKNFF